MSPLNKKMATESDLATVFLDIPHSVQWRIAQLVTDSQQHPMAVVSKQITEVLVENSSKICLALGNPASAAALLRKVCESGPSGKRLTIREDADEMDSDEWIFALPDLFRPSKELRSVGWTRIKELCILVSRYDGRNTQDPVLLCT
jgi:hypothetical protein